jgi:hypothetical protein
MPGSGHLTADRVVSHRLVTDARPLALARRHRARLATLDRRVAAMAGQQAGDVILVPLTDT